MNDKNIETLKGLIGVTVFAVVGLGAFLMFGPGSPNAQRREDDARRLEQERLTKHQQILDETNLRKRQEKLGLPNIKLLGSYKATSVDWGPYRFTLQGEGERGGHHPGWVVNSADIPERFLVPVDRSTMILNLQIQNTSNAVVPFPFQAVGQRDGETGRTIIWRPLHGVHLTSTPVVKVEMPQLRTPRPPQAGPPADSEPGLPASQLIASDDVKIPPGQFATIAVIQPLPSLPSSVEWIFKFSTPSTDGFEGVAFELDTASHGFKQYILELR